ASDADQRYRDLQHYKEQAVEALLGLRQGEKLYQAFQTRAEKVRDLISSVEVGRYQGTEELAQEILRDRPQAVHLIHQPAIHQEARMLEQQVTHELSGSAHVEQITH